MADRGFRASAADEAAYRSTLRSIDQGKMFEHRTRGREALGDRIDDFSDLELNAMEEMLGMPHQDINRAFRAGDTSVEQLPLVRMATSAMNKLPDHVGEIHRGITFDTVEELNAFLDNYAPGGSTREAAFTHSDKDPDGAKIFSGTEYGPARVVMHIDARHGKDMSFLRAKELGVDEVIHPPHTTFYPTKLEFDPETKTYHVHVRDHGGPEPEPPGGWQQVERVTQSDPGRDYWRQHVRAQNRQPAWNPFDTTNQTPPPPPGQPSFGPAGTQSVPRQAIDAQGNQPGHFGPTGTQAGQHPNQPPGQFGPTGQQPGYHPAAPEGQFGPPGQQQPAYNPGAPAQQFGPAGQQPGYAPGQPGGQFGPTGTQPGQHPAYNPDAPETPFGPAGQQPGQPGQFEPAGQQSAGQFGPAGQQPGHGPGQPGQFGPTGQQPGGQFGPPGQQQPGYSPGMPEQPFGPTGQQPTGEFGPTRTQPGPQQSFGPGQQAGQYPGHQPHPGHEPFGPGRRPEQSGYPPQQPPYPNQPAGGPHPGQPGHQPGQPGQYPGQHPGRPGQADGPFRVPGEQTHPGQQPFGPGHRQPEQPGYQHQQPGSPYGPPHQPGHPGHHPESPYQQPGRPPFGPGHRQPEQPYAPGRGPEQPGYPNQPGRHPGQPGYPNQPGQHPGQPGYPNQPGQHPGQPGYPNQPGQHPGQSGYPNQPGQSGYPNQPGQPGYPQRPGYPEQPGQQPFGPGHRNPEQPGYPQQPYGPPHQQPGQYPGQQPFGPGQPQRPGYAPQEFGPYARHTPEDPNEYGGHPPAQPDPYGSQPDPYGSSPDEPGEPGASDSTPDQPGAGGPSPESPGGAQASAGEDWRPGPSGFGVTNKTGFDPAFHHKALGDEFAPGVHDPEGVFEPWERDIADRLQDEGWRVDARFRDDSKQYMKNPDSMVRKDPADEGLHTEFKTPKSGGRNAIRRNINEASDQVPPDGEVVIDGRNVGLTREIADRAYGGAKGQPGKRVAAKVHIILGDGQVVTYVKEN